jgi:KAP family P-loop domain
MRKKNNISGGYDSPIQHNSEDALGRKPIVTTIVNLIKNTPAGWSLRIGLYGRWGSGKTSTLSFIQEVLENEGFTIVNFNPWGCSTETAMWQRLTADIKASSPPLTIVGKVKCSFEGIKLRLFGLKVSPLSDVISLPPDKEVIIKKALKTIDNLLDRIRFSSKDAERITGKTKHQIIVLIDDVDRLDPSLIPPLLFTLKEILDSKYLRFVLAFDPSIVSKALSNYHSGFESSRQFLEKILDYHFEILEPIYGQTTGLLWNEVSKTDIEFMRDAILENRDYVFRNPRKLKMLVRYVAAFKPILEMYEDDQIDRTTIIKALILRLFATELLDGMNSQGGIGELMPRLHNDRNHLVNDDFAKAKEEVRVKVRSLKGLDQDEEDKIFSLLVDIGSRYSTYAIKKLEEALIAIDSPSNIGRKEIRTIISKASNSDEAKEFLKKRIYGNEGIIPSLIEPIFNSTCSLYSKSLRDIADSDNVEHQEVVMKLAKECIDILGAIIHWAKEEKKNFYLGAESFSHILGIHKQWSNFHGIEDSDLLREGEKSLLQSLIEIECSLPEELLEVLSPWWSQTGADPAYIAPTVQHLAKVVEAKMAVNLFTELITDNYVVDSFKEKKYARRYFLFSPRSPIWADIESLSRATSMSKLIVAIQNNFYDWFMYIEDQVLGNSLQPIQGVEDVARNVEIMKKLYLAATCKPLPRRKDGSLKAAREKLEEKYNYNLLPTES